MIQDIFPHKLYNEYRPAVKPEKDGIVLCFCGQKVLVKDSWADIIKAPVPSEIPSGNGTVPGEDTAGKENAPTPCVGKDERDLRVGQENEPAILFPVYSQLPAGGKEVVYAFRIDDMPYFLDISGEMFEIDGFAYTDIREIRSFATNLQGMIIFTGNHLYQWYSNSRYCGSCGSRAVHDKKERAMTCPACGKVNYPRLMPAVIVGVTHADQLLVTKYREGYNHFALIAGFAEIGESLEETVAREVMEETGLKVKNIRYYKSQPWGIAQDILAGFFCEVDGDPTINMDANELKLAQWRSKETIELQPDSYSLTNEMMEYFKNSP